MRENPPPAQNGWVDVPHARICWETSGAPDGVPVLYLHGGPDGTLAFLANGLEILPRIHELNGIPAYLIHGRRDISGPAVTAWQLHQRWESSRLVVVEDEGHGGPVSMAALTRAVEEIAAAVFPGPGTP